jgi:hypothetical protein
VEDGQKSFTLTLKNNILKAAEKMTRGYHHPDVVESSSEYSLNVGDFLIAFCPV